jgi:hypothetical protein
MQVQLNITVTSTGGSDSSIEVEGPIDNWPWCFAVLEAAKHRITNYHANKINKTERLNDLSDINKIDGQ